MKILNSIRNVLTKGGGRPTKLLSDLGSTLRDSLDMDEVSGAVLQASRMLGYQKGIILLWEEERLEFAPRANFGAGQFDLTIPTGHALIDHVTKTRQPFSAQDSLPKGVQDAFAWLVIDTVVPLFTRRELTGLLLLKSGSEVSSPTVLQEIAMIAGPALEHARLYQQERDGRILLKRDFEEMTQELSSANVQLRNLDKAKSEFLSIASHQLYTPLTALRGYISMIQDGDFGEISDKQKPVLSILEKSATRLIDLIKNLLDVSRIESGRLELKLEKVDLVTMAKEVVAVLAPNAQAKRLQLEFHDSAAPVSPVVVDQERVRQVMLNFIDNAIKYTTLGKVDVYVYEKGDQVLFSVKDTGKGIRQEDIAQLFRKFMRVGGASTFHTEGTGLGLYVARQIVREHHGEVQVESPGENQGSTFIMQLPAAGTKTSLRPGQNTTVDIMVKA